MTQFGQWCPEIYRSMYVERVNQDKATVAPCCQAQGHLVDLENLSFHADPVLVDLRAKFAAGHKPSACNRCWQLEDLGQKSRRLSAIEFFGMSQPDTTVRLESLDHNVTWACNLACVMCGPACSSFWAKQLKFDQTQLFALGKTLIKYNGFLDQLNLQNLKKLHFNGGEPLLNNDHAVILQHLDQQDILQHVFISYNTNGTVFPSQKVIDLWQKTKLVKLFFSIDATQEAFEYIRWPANWIQTQKNIQEMKNILPSNVMFGFNVTVGCHNIFELVDVVQWFDRNLDVNREGDVSDFSMQFANNFALTNLPPAALADAIEYLSSVPRLNEIAWHLKSQLNYQVSDEWINQLEAIDKQRNTSWRHSLKIGKYY